MKKGAFASLRSISGIAGAIGIVVLVWTAAPPAAVPAASAHRISRAAPSEKITSDSAPARSSGIAGPSASQPPFSDPAAARRQEAELARKRTEIRTAIETAARIPDPVERALSLGTLCYRWAEFDPRGAVELAFDHDLDRAPGEILENLTQQWAATDFAAARAWVDGQAPGENRDRLVARISMLLAQSDPATAADYVVKKIPPGSEQTEAAISVIYQWTRQDPEAATAWARNFPAGPLRDRALKEALAGVSTRTDN